MHPLSYIVVPDKCRIETDCDNVINISNFLDILAVDSQFKDRIVDVKLISKIIERVNLS
ncbi:hypothetical protein D3C81_2282400 [compost metagenome]